MQVLWYLTPDVLSADFYRYSLYPTALLIILVSADMFESYLPRKGICNALYIYSYLLMAVLISHLFAPGILPFKIPYVSENLYALGMMLHGELEHDVFEVISSIMVVFLGFCLYFYDDRKPPVPQIRAMLYHLFFRTLYHYIVYSDVYLLPLLVILLILYIVVNVSVAFRVSEEVVIDKKSSNERRFVLVPSFHPAVLKDQKVNEVTL